MSTFMTALLNTVMGMVTVFCVLIFISLIISLFVYIPSLERRLKSLIRRSKGGKKKPSASLDDSQKPAPKRPVLVRKEDLPEKMDDNELIAVIMAAIVAAEGGAVSADKLVVRSIRRVRKRR